MSHKVDVIMPCFNAERFLKESIESILNQTHDDFRFIIIDDGSTDGSLEIIRQYAHTDSRIDMYSNNGNKGARFTRNRGIDLSSAEYVALMDADDISVRNRLEIEVDYLDNHPDIAVVASDKQIIDGNGNYIRVERMNCYTKEDVLCEFLFFNMISNPSAMYRNSIIKENNIKYEARLIEDYHFWLKVIEKAPMVVIPEILLNYRINTGGLTDLGLSSQREERNRILDNIRNEFLEYFNINLSHFEKDAILNGLHEEVGYGRMSFVNKLLYALGKRKVRKKLKYYYGDNKN